MTAASLVCPWVYSLVDSGHGCLAYVGIEFAARVVPGILPGSDAAFFPVFIKAHWPPADWAIGVIIVQGIISAIPVIGNTCRRAIKLGHKT